MVTPTRYSYNVSDILKDVKQKIYAATKVDVFTSRPLNNKKERTAMIVIGLPYSVRQRGAYQSTYLRVEVIVKDKTEGVSNIAKLEELVNKIQALFPMKSTDEKYHANIPYLTLTGHDTIGFTIWNLQGSMTISKLDTY